MKNLLNTAKSRFSSKPEPNPNDAEDRAVDIMGSAGRTLPFSTLQSDLDAHKNANVCTSADVIWFGDIQLNNPKTVAKLQALADDLGREIYVLREMDVRLYDAPHPIIQKALLVVEPTATKGT